MKGARRRIVDTVFCDFETWSQPPIESRPPTCLAWFVEPFQMWLVLVELQRSVCLRNIKMRLLVRWLLPMKQRVHSCCFYVSKRCCQRKVHHFLSCEYHRSSHGEKLSCVTSHISWIWFRWVNQKIVSVILAHLLGGGARAKSPVGKSSLTKSISRAATSLRMITVSLCFVSLSVACLSIWCILIRRQKFALTSVWCVWWCLHMRCWRNLTSAMDFPL